MAYPLDFGQAFCQDVFIHVTYGGDFGVGNARVPLHVVHASAVDANDRDAHAVVRADDTCRAGQRRSPSERHADGCRSGPGLKEITPTHLEFPAHVYSLLRPQGPT